MEYCRKDRLCFNLFTLHVVIWFAIIFFNMKTSRIYYRIVEVDKDNNYKTLFHGYGQKHRRLLPINQWVKADERMVDDGGTEYLSGFHVIKERKDCEKYLTRFTRNRKLKIVSCECMGMRRKEHSNSPVLLARYMKIIG